MSCLIIWKAALLKRMSMPPMFFRASSTTFWQLARSLRSVGNR